MGPDETPEDLKELGNTLFKKRKYVDALRAYDRALEIDDRFLPALYNKGMTLLKLDLADEAMSAVKKGLEISPRSDRLLSLQEKCEKAIGKDRTPTFFIDGRRYRAEITHEELVDVLEEEFERIEGIQYLE